MFSSVIERSLIVTVLGLFSHQTMYAFAPSAVRCELKRDANDIPDRQLILKSVEMVVRKANGGVASDVYLKGTLNGNEYYGKAECRSDYGVSREENPKFIQVIVAPIKPLHQHLRDPNLIDGEKFMLKEQPRFNGVIQSNGSFKITEVRGGAPYTPVQCQSLEVKDFPMPDCQTGYYNSMMEGHCVIGNAEPNDHFAKLCKKYGGSPLSCDDTVPSLCSIDILRKIVTEKKTYEGYDSKGNFVKCKKYPSGFSNAVETEFMAFCEENGGVLFSNCEGEITKEFDLCSKKVDYVPSSDE